MNSSNPLDRLGLPPLYHFHRPFWAYEYLGWALLREHLFGQSWRLTDGLDALGDEPVSPQQVAHLLDEAHMPMMVRSQIVAAMNGQNARELVTWYRDWEDEVFEAYLTRERDIENRMLGK